jgi:hypothetical protein
VNQLLHQGDFHLSFSYCNSPLFHDSSYAVMTGALHIQVFTKGGATTVKLHEKQSAAYMPPCCCISICSEVIIHVLETTKLTISIIHTIFVSGQIILFLFKTRCFKDWILSLLLGETHCLAQLIGIVSIYSIWNSY